MKRQNGENWGVVGLWLTFLGTIIVVGSIWNPDMLNTGIVMLILGIVATFVGLVL